MYTLVYVSRYVPPNGEIPVTPTRLLLSVISTGPTFPAAAATAGGNGERHG